MPDSDFQLALRALHTEGVEFLIVGGLAAVLNGAPVDTFDLDIVPSRDEVNLEKLLRVLESLDARGKCGPLDISGTIGRGLGYEELLPHTIAMDIGDGVRVRVLNLSTIIALKEELGGEKDLAVLPILRRTLELKRQEPGIK